MQLGKALIAFLAFLLIAAIPSHAALSEMAIDIELNEDSIDWTVRQTYNETVSKTDFFLFSDIRQLSATADGVPTECSAAIQAGTTILCERFTGREIVYKIKTDNNIDNIGDMKRFAYRFAVTQFTGKYAISLKLPLGAALAESDRLEGTGLRRFEPSWGRETTDGRRIIVEWVATEPRLGETYDVSVVYETLEFNIDSSFLPFLVVIVVIVLFLSIFYRRKGGAEAMLPVLTGAERKVMEIVLKAKKVDQRQIVKETDFSKTKVTRLIQTLESRGLVQRERKGRNNTIMLRKEAKTGDSEKGK